MTSENLLDIVGGEGCDDGFSASHISLEKSEHRFPRVKVVDNLLYDFFLSLGELKRELSKHSFEDFSLLIRGDLLGVGLVIEFIHEREKLHSE